jgi:hypothetical protein
VCIAQPGAPIMLAFSGGYCSHLKQFIFLISIMGFSWVKKFQLDLAGIVALKIFFSKEQ